MSAVFREHGRGRRRGAQAALAGETTPSAAHGSQVPYRISNDDRRNGAVAISEEGIACTKVVCNYIHQTYGRFPATVDAMHLMWLMQAHHLDTDYYDRFFRPRNGTYAGIHFASVD
jgi:hypothetical protein